MMTEAETGVLLGRDGGRGYRVRNIGRWTSEAGKGRETDSPLRKSRQNQLC